MRHFLIPLVMLAAGGVRADDPSAQLPVKLRADRIEIDQKTGISRYLGHVVMTQGATRFTADRAEASSQDHALSRITADGTPVTFRHPLADESGVVEGEAGHAEYDAIERRIDLAGRVEIRRDMDRIRAGRARYMLDEETFHAEKDGDQRVTAAIEPRKRDGEDTNP